MQVVSSKKIASVKKPKKSTSRKRNSMINTPKPDEIVVDREERNPETEADKT